MRARGDALQDGSLGGADQAGRAFIVVILLQIERQHDAVSGLAGDGAFHQDEACMLHEEIAVEVFLHVGTDLLNTAVFFRGVKVDLRQGDAVGRRRVAHGFGHLLPVLRFGGELVTGDDCPLVKSMPGLGRRILGAWTPIEAAVCIVCHSLASEVLPLFYPISWVCPGTASRFPVSLGSSI